MITQVSLCELNKNRKFHVEQKEKSLLDSDSMHTNCESMAYRSFRSEEYSSRGVSKVTTGIIGLWQPSVHSDVAFRSIDVVFSYH